MSDEIYTKFWNAVGQQSPGGATYHDLVRASRKAFLSMKQELKAKDAGALAKAQEINDALAAIGGKQAHNDYYDAKLKALFAPRESMNFETGGTFSQRARALGGSISKSFQSGVARFKGLLPSRSAPTEVAEMLPEAITQAPAAAAPVAHTPHAFAPGAILADATHALPDVKYTLKRQIPRVDSIRYAIDDIRVAAGNTFSNSYSSTKVGASALAAKASDGWRSLLTRAKGLSLQRIPSLGEPMAETATNVARGAALEPMANQLILNASEIPNPTPVSMQLKARMASVLPNTAADSLASVAEEALPDLNITLKRKIPFFDRVRFAAEDMRTAAGDAYGNARAAFSGARTSASEIFSNATARAKGMLGLSASSVSEPIADVALNAAATSTETARTLGERQAEVRAASEGRIAAAKATQAEAAASLAGRIAQAKEAAAASFQAPKGTLLKRFGANTANLAEHMTMPLTKLFGTKDPYKILGITPHTSQTAATEAFHTQLSALGERRLNSPKAQREMVQLNDAYEAVYDNLLERPKFTTPAIQTPSRTSKIGAAIGRAREATTSMFDRVKGLFKGKPPAETIVAASTATDEIKLLTGPAAEIVETIAKKPAGFQHGGKLLVAGGVVAAAAVAYFATRKPEKQPAPTMNQPRRQDWAESLQTAANADMQR